MLIQHFKNPNKNNGRYPKKLKSVLNIKDCNAAYNEIKTWKNYETTPLISLKKIAKDIGVKNIYYKDESPRFKLGSFKALGGTYGVLKFIYKTLKKEIGNEVTISNIKKGFYAKVISKYTVTTATDGNHGRSVAFGAKVFGCKCQIFIHSEVSIGRKNAMEKLNAKVIRIKGNYDKSLKVCKNQAKKNNWYIISDTSYKGYIEYPRYIMAGYTVMAKEIKNQLANKNLPTHVFLQGGVGSFPASITSYFWQEFEANIKNIIVETEMAPCLIKSAQNNKMTSFNISEETIMAGLSCGEPSLLGWKILNQSADHYLTIDDASIPATMRLLSNTIPKIEAGESSVAGLACLYDLTKEKGLTKKLDINNESVILIFGTEGATDPEIYKSIIERID